jgi:hypothetical protein
MEIYNFFTALSQNDGINLTLTLLFFNYSFNNYSNTRVFASVFRYFLYSSDNEGALDFNLHTN